MYCAILDSISGLKWRMSPWNRQVMFYSHINTVESLIAVCINFCDFLPSYIKIKNIITCIDSFENFLPKDYKYHHMYWFFWNLSLLHVFSLQPVLLACEPDRIVTFHSPVRAKQLRHQEHRWYGLQSVYWSRITCQFLLDEHFQLLKQVEEVIITWHVHCMTKLVLNHKYNITIGNFVFYTPVL